MSTNYRNANIQTLLSHLVQGLAERGLKPNQAALIREFERLPGGETWSRQLLSNWINGKFEGGQGLSPGKIQVVARYMGLSAGQLSDAIERPPAEFAQFLRTYKIRAVATTLDQLPIKIESLPVDSASELQEICDSAIELTETTLSRLKELRESLSQIQCVEPLNPIAQFLVDLEQKTGPQLWANLQISQERYETLKKSPALITEGEIGELSYAAILLDRDLAKSPAWFKQQLALLQKTQHRDRTDVDGILA